LANKERKKTGKNRREVVSLTMPDGFAPQIKFYPKQILIDTSKMDLIKYYDILIEKYRQLKLIIPKPEVIEKIFKKMASSPNIEKNIEKEALLPSVYETQIKIRNVEILNFLENEKGTKSGVKKTAYNNVYKKDSWKK
jgi:hypothetical protein